MLTKAFILLVVVQSGSCVPVEYANRESVSTSLIYDSETIVSSRWGANQFRFKFLISM